jgi:hypothetical protein
MPTGFACYNRFERDIRAIRQLYDFTAHLYAEQNEALAAKRVAKTSSASMHTIIGTVTHNVNRLYEYTRSKYPEQLRRLLLLSAVAYVEGYLSELVREIATRTLAPFKSQDPLEVTKGKLLSLASVETLAEDIVEREVRQLTNGGLQDFAKYFKKKFGIAFGAVAADYGQLLEIHDRRHLHVHRNGICDATYAHQYPAAGFKPGDLVPVPQDYLLNSLAALRHFGVRVRDEALAKFPESVRRRRTVMGGRPAPSCRDDPLIVRLELTSQGYDPLTAIPKLPVPHYSAAVQLTVQDFLHQLIVEEAMCLCVISGTEDEIRAVMQPLSRSEEFVVRSVSKVFG